MAKSESSHESSWEIETLIRNAFTRTKERFLTYILAYLMMYAAVFAVTLLLLVIGVFAFCVFAHQATLLVGMLIAAFIILAIIAFIYISAFTQLVVVHILVREHKGTIMQNIKEVKEDVWGYAWVVLATCIFFIGLIPLGVLSLFTIFILWALWGSFTTFVYVTHKMNGLDNLWASYAMVKQRFWGVAGRLALVSVGYLLISAVLSVRDNAVLNILQFILSLVFGPFVLSYQYEIFKLLRRPTSVVRPKAWIVVSVGGYAFMLICAFYLLPQIRQNGVRLKEYIEQQNNQQELQKGLKKDLKKDLQKDLQKDLRSFQNNNVRYPRSS